jgi:hypothetical protein
MNFRTMQDHTIRNLGNRTDLATLVPEWLNTCYLDVITTGRLPELGKFAPIPVPELDTTGSIYTSDGVATVAQPANLLFPISLRDMTNGAPLREWTIQYYDRHHGTVEGKPYAYALFSKTFYIEPTPDAVYTIQVRYRKDVTIPALVADADVSVIGSVWHELLVFGASYRGALSLGYPDADKWMTAGKAYMSSHSEMGSEEDADANFGFAVRL